MMTSARYLFLVIVTILSLHLLISFSNDDYKRVTSLARLKDKVVGSPPPPRVPPYQVPIPDAYHVPHDYDVLAGTGRRANATILMLARNGDVEGVVSSVKQMEDRFNKRFRYPYVFLNEEAFEDGFMSRIRELTDAEVEFGRIPKEHWEQPPEIDEDRASRSREGMRNKGVIYGGSIPYRNMCRFNSGFFYRHELLQKYQYYWRVEPQVTFFCDLNEDPFVYMEDNDKMYGFTISLYEYEATIPTLWKTVKEFMANNSELVVPGNAMEFISDDAGETYNRCHFWSNFEIANLDLWRGEAYTKFFAALDASGGFYYERWGDAPVHSIAAALFLKKEQVHFFNDIGYRHEPYQHCPQGAAHAKGKCWCDRGHSFDYDWNSCLKRYETMFT